eukprot:483410_1
MAAICDVFMEPFGASISGINIRVLSFKLDALPSLCINFAYKTLDLVFALFGYGIHCVLVQFASSHASFTLRKIQNLKRCFGCHHSFNFMIYFMDTSIESEDYIMYSHKTANNKK